MNNIKFSPFAPGFIMLIIAIFSFYYTFNFKNIEAVNIDSGIIGKLDSVDNICIRGIPVTLKPNPLIIKNGKGLKAYQITEMTNAIDRWSSLKEGRSVYIFYVNENFYSATSDEVDWNNYFMPERKVYILITRWCFGINAYFFIMVLIARYGERLGRSRMKKCL